MKLPQIPQDKANHFIYGTLICFISSLFLHNPIISLGITIVVGASKEIYDKISGKGNPEILDLVFTVLGGLIIFLTQITK